MYWEIGYGFIPLLLLMLAASSIRILCEYQRGVVMEVPAQDVITHSYPLSRSRTT